MGWKDWRPVISTTMKPLEEIIDLSRLNIFLSKIDYRGENGCWNWIAGKKLGGYGEFKPFLGQGKNNRATHAIMWEIRNGAIPKGLHIDHLCRNTSCLNPKHLEPVTPQENLRRGGSASALNARKTHCKCGREFDVFRKSRNGRGCSHCLREATRRYRARQKGLL